MEIEDGMQQMHLGGQNEDEVADEAADGEPFKEPLELEEVCCLHDGQKVWCVSWSPSPCTGAEYMIAGGESNTIIWQCNDSNWSILTVLSNKGKGYIRSCAWSLDGRILAVGGFDSNITIWEYKGPHGDLFKVIANIYGPCDHIIRSLSWNTNGILLSCSNDGNVCLIGKSKGTYDVECRICECQISETSCAIWHPNQITFAIAGHKKIKIYKVGHDGKAYHTHTMEDDRCGHKGGIEGISYWKDGDFMASAGTSMKIWGWTNKDTSSGSTSISITSEKEYDSDIVDHYETQDPRGGFSCCDWSRCNNESIGYLLATACLFSDIYIFVQYTDDKGGLANRVGATRLDAHNGGISDLKWHPKDAGLLASGGSDGIKIWKVKGEVKYSQDSWIIRIPGRKSSRSKGKGAPHPTSTKRMRRTPS